MNPLVPTPSEVLVLVLAALAAVLWLAALWSLAKDRHFTPSQRLLWLVFILLAPVLGPAVWLTTGRRAGRSAAH